MTNKSKATGTLKAEQEEDRTHKTVAASTSDNTDSDLEAVRDILFGAQLRHGDQQREALSQELTSMIKDLAKSTHDQFDRLQKEMQTIHQEQNKSSEHNRLALDKKIDALDLSLTALDKQTSRIEADLIDNIDTNISALNNQMEHWKEELFAQLDQVQQHLSHDKTDRGALADMFSLMSEQLMKDSEPKK